MRYRVEKKVEYVLIADIMRGKMISDVLCEAVDEIDHYLSDPFYEDVYTGACRAEIIKVRAAMDELRRKLDIRQYERAKNGDA